MIKILEKVISYSILNYTAFLGKMSYNSYKKKSKVADKISEKKLIKVIKKNQNTEFGKKYNFSSIKSIKEFQEKIPYTTYEDYAQYIERTANTGEQNLITADKICYFAATSGTTGNYKKIPVVKSTFIPFFKNGTIFVYNLKKEMKKRKRGALCGKILNLSEASSMDVTSSGIKVGVVTGYFTSGFKTILSSLTCIPKEVIGFEKDVDMKYINARFALEEENVICINAVFMSALVDLLKYIEDNIEVLLKDIETGTIDTSIKMPENIRKKIQKRLKPNKERASRLRKIFEEPTHIGIIPKIWKRLSLIISIGNGEFSPYKDKMKQYCSDKVPFSASMYVASEATIACALEVEEQNYTLIFDGGFYEFLEIDGDNKPLLMNELEIGKEYEIVVTNFTGLYRYKLKDVVKVVGYEGKIPIIQYAYRKNQLVNISGLHLNTEQFVKIIKNYEKVLDVNIIDYSLYIDTDHSPSRMLIFIETEKPIKVKQDISRLFDEQVNIEFPGFDGVIKKGILSKSLVHIVKPKTYETFRENKIKSGVPINQIKTVRLINDKNTLGYFMNQIKKLV